MGSGLGILSKWPIVRVAWHRYQLNGSPHFLTHGDWYSGKGVGACRIEAPDGTTIDAYNTHLHAEYAKSSMQYVLHQLGQLSEYRRMMETMSGPFIKTHVVLGLGDLNCYPDSIPYRAVFEHSALSLHPRFSLLDAWTHAKQLEHPHDNETGATYNLASSRYYRGGRSHERIDYIHYVPNERVLCTKSHVVVAEEDVTMSDHALVAADFLVLAPGKLARGDLPVASETYEASQAKNELNTKVVELFDRDMRRLRIRQAVFRALSGICTILFLGCFIGALVMIMAELGSSLAQAALVSISPLPLALSLLAVLVSELAVPEERAALNTLRDEWRIWYENSAISVQE